MSYKAHGEYRILVNDLKVFGYPSGFFNEEGISAYYHDILKRTQDLEKWTYYVQPSKDFGLTPQANKVVMFYLQQLILNGCIAIAIRVQSMLAESVASQLKLAAFVALKISEDNFELEEFLDDQLEKHNNT